MNQPCVVWKASETAPRGSVYERFSQTGRATSHTSPGYNIQAKSQAPPRPYSRRGSPFYTRRRGKQGGCMVGTYAQTARSNAGPGDGLTPASRCQLIITAPVLARRGASGSAAGWWVVVRAGVRQTRRRWWDGWAIGGGRLATTMANGRGARRCRCWRRAYSMAVSDHSRPTSR